MYHYYLFNQQILENDTLLVKYEAKLFLKLCISLYAFHYKEKLREKREMK